LYDWFYFGGITFELKKLDMLAE